MGVSCRGLAPLSVALYFVGWLSFALGHFHPNNSGHGGDFFTVQPTFKSLYSLGRMVSGAHRGGGGSPPPAPMCN